jgi:membrane fusion protein, copper/silver efflux system
MKTRTTFLALIAAGVLGSGGYGLYKLGLQRGSQQHTPQTVSTNSATMPDSKTQSRGLIDPATGKRILYWQDPMVPGQRFDKPGKSPFMDMQLVPVYADDDGAAGTVSINPRVQQNLGIRTAEVTKSTLTPSFETVGSVAYNERDVAVVQARANGYLERLYVRAPLDPVRKGQALADIYVPDWVAAQEDYLAVRRMDTNAPEGLLDGARQRMRLAGMSDAQIRLVESSSKVQPRMMVTAPIGGVVTELVAREGMTIMSGAPLFRLNGLATVWVNAEVPESLAAQVRPGNVVQATTSALPGETFHGKFSAILPEVNATTRTLKARVELANPSGQLVPGMFVRVSFTPAGRKEVLLIPSEAVIQTGKRSVVMVSQGEGKFMPINIEVGVEANGQIEVRKGLEAGQKVVVSGQFLVDSEASLKGVETRLNTALNALDHGTAGKAAITMHQGTGKVESIDKDEIMLSHGPIPSLQWEPMTMGFKLPTTGLPKNIAVGDTVEFEFHRTPEGQFQIMTIVPAAKPSSRDVKGVTK